MTKATAFRTSPPWEGSVPWRGRNGRKDSDGGHQVVWWPEPGGGAGTQKGESKARQGQQWSGRRGSHIAPTGEGLFDTVTLCWLNKAWSVLGSAGGKQRWAVYWIGWICITGALLNPNGCAPPQSFWFPVPVFSLRNCVSDKLQWHALCGSGLNNSLPWPPTEGPCRWFSYPGFYFLEMIAD